MSLLSQEYLEGDPGILLNRQFLQLVGFSVHIQPLVVILLLVVLILTF